MRNIIVTLLFILNLSLEVKSQSVTFKLDSILYFEHDANITTGEAIRQESATILGIARPYSVFSFDFENMVLYYREKADEFHKCVITEKEITAINDSQLNFHCVVISFDTHEYLDVIVAPGTNPDKGAVLYIRWNKETDGRKLVKGYSATNLVWKERFAAR